MTCSYCEGTGFLCPECLGPVPGEQPTCSWCGVEWVVCSCAEPQEPDVYDKVDREWSERNL